VVAFLVEGRASCEVLLGRHDYGYNNRQYGMDLKEEILRNQESITWRNPFQALPPTLLAEVRF